MKRILVPTDFSDCSRNALQFASNLAKKSGGKIYLIHVIESDDTDTGAGGSGAWAGAAGNSGGVPLMIGYLSRIKGRIVKFISESQVDSENIIHNIESGIPYLKTNKAAEKYKADVIVMGTHGASGLKDVFIGSTAEKVVQHATRPVISIKESPNLNPSTIIFATDFSSEADRVFEKVRSFADIFNAKLHLLKVNRPERFETNTDIEARIIAFRNQHNASNCPYTVVSDFKSETGILHFAKDVKADLIAIGTHGKGGLARFFNGSISEELVNHSFCPVLTINFKEKVKPDSLKLSESPAIG